MDPDADIGPETPKPEINRPNILFLNMGWMNAYAGPDGDDPTRGNFGWLKADRSRVHGHECYNFANENQQCWGNHPSSEQRTLRN